MNDFKHAVTDGFEYVQFRNINVSNMNKMEMSDEFFDDMEKIINKVKKKGMNFDGYEIHIILREKNKYNPSDNDEILYESFLKDPYIIRNELDVELLIKYIRDHIGSDFYPFTENFFKAFIAVNHDHEPREFEEEYNVSMDNISDISVPMVCEIANNELDWMGLGWEFVPIYQKDEKIWCQKKDD